ncbi:MAG TPA: NADH-ubiquinone oxidoreductase-F iron-sulfur binding region domain-containing protein [Streptosporangiaceae bacterium]|nr:NADH-ubiquinone oxidoreductase-F iron-sulfur binding region domain-containing protein [Streptosporangiaceae bacterium]
MTRPGAQRVAGAAPRLTLGWRDATGPAGLPEHRDRFGPLPPAGRGLLDAAEQAGLTGRGGSGFPSAVKMRAVAAGRGPAVVVANGMESEPVSRKDQALLARNPHLVLDGAVLAARAVGADVIHVCLDRNRAGQVSDIRRAVEERWWASVDPTPIQVEELPAHYVSSEETALIRWLNGGEAKPMTTPPRPYERGVRRRPTLVSNVETLAHLALIARFGPGWFRAAGTPRSPGTMLVTAAGAVRQSGVYEIECGTPVGEVLAMSEADDAAAAVLIGGYFGTWHHIRDIARLPLSKDGLRPVGAAVGAGVVFALPAGRCGLAETARILGYLAAQGAQQCGPCRFGLPAIADDFAQLSAGRPDGDPLARLERRLGVISGRGACRHPDGAVRMAASALTAFAADARSHAARRPCAGAGAGRAPTAVLPVTRPWAEEPWR